MAPRLIDADCSNASCGFQYRDHLLMSVPDIIQCPHCHAVMKQLYLPRTKRDTCWAASEAVVVFKKPDGSFSFPMRNDKPTPPGCERIVARSDRELAAIERASGTLSERRWFDSRTTARGFDSTFRGERYD